RLVAHHVAAERTRPQRPLVVGRVADAAEHDAAAERPGQLRVLHDVTVAVDGGLFEAQRVREEADQAGRGGGAQGRPDGRSWTVVGHMSDSASANTSPAWMNRNSLGEQPANSANSRAMWAWS